MAIYGTLWGIKAFLLRKGPAAVQTGWIRIWETVHLSPHRTLYLVEINGRLLILGATDHQVSLLTELDRSAIGEQSPFAAQFAQIVGEPIMPDLSAKIGVAFDGLRGVMNRLRDMGHTEGA
jgi:flagellar biosynthetic protein FliO